MKKVIISPYSRKLKNGKENPKNYPYWEELVSLLKEEGYSVVQIGCSDEKKIFHANEYKFDLSFEDLKKELLDCDFWISVDSFVNHLGAFLNKKGFVIWSLSDPEIFGYKTNINLLKDRRYLRKNQFHIWETENFNKEAFMSPSEIIINIKSHI